VRKIETRVFIQEKFAQYYNLDSLSINAPSSLASREFAFLLFKEKRMLRHKNIRDIEDLRTMLKAVVPSDVYYSSAHYEKPEEEMDTKGWLGADLVFDIDADHMPTPCGKQHDTWTCSNCGATGRGSKPENCPRCRGLRFDDKSWPCEICLESTKKETIKLHEVLTNDFGLSPQEMIIAFSGHRGYHVHVESQIVQTLDQIARREIVDYLVGIGFEPRFQGLEDDRVPNLEETGWRGRIAKGTYEFLLDTSIEQLEEMGFRKSAVNNLDKQRDKILESWKGKEAWRIKGVGPESWKKIVRKAIENQSVKIDTVVTTDIHRLIRLANTLHGKTGLKKTLVSASDIERFDPLKSAVAFKGGSVRLLVYEAPEFRLGDERFGPYKNCEAELPTAAALFLLCKGAAHVMEDPNSVR
jgi:DNA primase small subunit